MPEPTAPNSTAATHSLERPLEVEDLTVSFTTRNGLVQAVDGVSYGVDRGQVLAVVGESGSGKSASALAMLGLLPETATIGGSVRVCGHDMVSLPERAREGVRGQRIAMVFQDALASLNPFRTVGRQLMDAYRIHHRQASTAQARERAVEMLGLVGMTNPRARADQYPHEFSGGMRQRAMIAEAIINNPDVLIADEPTTALDVTVQAQVLDLLLKLTGELGMAMVLITHDLGVVAQTADEVLVMYAGRVAERGTVAHIFDTPQHPYTVGLHRATPDLTRPREQLQAIPGTPASGTNRPTGCPFHPRCPRADEIGQRCVVELPELQSCPPMGTRHVAACHLLDLPSQGAAR